jgi:hypothetical protein
MVEVKPDDAAITPDHSPTANGEFFSIPGAPQERHLAGIGLDGGVVNGGRRGRTSGAQVDCQDLNRGTGDT